MKRAVYPAIFHKEEEGGYWVEFPDLPGCHTDGETLEEAFLMAGDALNCWLSADDAVRPQATPLSEIAADPDAVVMLVQPVLYLSDGAKQYYIEEAITNGLKRAKLTKSQAAETLCKGRGYITRLIRMEETPTQDEAKKLAELLGFDWKLFFLNDRGEL